MTPTPPPITIRLRGEDTQGRLAVIETVVGPDFGGPPLHIHPCFDETFYGSTASSSSSSTTGA
jgi:hypothetical protein